ncbi:MAG: hypothetical protein WBF21_04875 [Steroidobacteraceae bacterium]
MHSVNNRGIRVAWPEALSSSARRSTGFGALLAAFSLSILAAPASAGHGGGGYVMVMPGYSVKPRKDQICVVETLTVGQRFKNANGDLLTVKELSGKSPMCRNARTPILAEVEFIPSATWQSSLSIELPEGYTAVELSEKERFDGARLHAVNKAKDVSVYVQSWDRRKQEPIFNLYVDNDKRAWANRGFKSKQTETEKLTIHGAKAQRWESEIPGPTFLAPSFTHLTTDLLGDSEIVYLDVVTLTRKFAAVREEAKKIGESLTGLVKEEPAVDAAATQATDNGPGVATAP